MTSVSTKTKPVAKKKSIVKAGERPKLKAVQEPAVKEKPKLIDLHSKTYQAWAQEYGVITGRHLQKQQVEAPVYSTGCLVLDWACRRRDPVFGNGGIPEANMIELFGPTGVGKTITLFSIAAQVQKRGKLVAIAFSEEPSMEFAEAMGVDIDSLIVIDAWSGKGKYIKDKKTKKKIWDATAIKDELDNLAEIVLPKLVAISKNPDVGLVALDSIKGLVGAGQVFKKGDMRAAKPRGFEESDMAVRAKFVEKFINQLKSRKNAIVILVNHSSQAITTGHYGLPDRDEGTNGGAYKEYDSVYRIKVTSRAFKDAPEHPLFKYKVAPGIVLRYKLVKARWGGKGRVVSTNFYFQRLKPKYVAPHFDSVGDILKCATFLKIIKYEGGWYRWGKNNSSHGIKEATKYLKQHPELVDSLARQVNERSEELFEINKADDDFSKSIELPMSEEDDDDLDDEDFDDDDED